MNFVFEKISYFTLFGNDELYNFVDCPDVNPSGIKRFTVSPLISTLIRYKHVGEHFSNFDFSHIKVESDPSKFSKYIIATGVTHSPNDWCGSEKKSIFSYLNERYLEDAKKGKALILLDQSHEGYHEDWMYESLHNQCDTFGINPNQIIYVTGNLEEDNQYNKWLEGRKVVGKMCIVPYSHFECMINETKLNRERIEKKIPLPTFTDHVKYKTSNLPNIKTYNCLQKRPRVHRIWMFKELVDNNLLDFGINSMNYIDFEHTYYFNKEMSISDYESIKKYLPMIPPSQKPAVIELKLFSDNDSGDYQTNFNEQILLDTWVSIVSEALFGEDTCFISEKTFKPIAASHPFMVLGNKYSIKNLQKLGYKTFHPFIDESYDELDTWERLDAIIKETVRINSFTQEEKLNWFLNLEDILKHNVQILHKNSKDLLPTAVLKIDDYFRSYNVPTTN